MSAHEQMRAMLDELMGTARDGDSTNVHVNFTDRKVCKSFLLKCCPHDILAATRMDLGSCFGIHDLALRADYENAAKTKDFFYDVDALEQLEQFVKECDRRTDQAKKKLAETQEELSAEATVKLNKINELAEQIGKKLAEAEAKGAEGLVDESMAIMEQVEKAKKKKHEAEAHYRNSMPASSYQQQKLRVCEVCSAYLGIYDNDRRLADHFGGKLHLGFIEIREKLEELRKQVDDSRKAGKANREREERREKEAKREERDHRERERERDRDRERGREHRDRHHRRRSRSRDREYRRKDRDRRDRSRDRGGDRRRHRRDR
ncbi:putative RNA-binding protein Luc7 2 isoform X1 [Tropilaelaps mercedesae]|uniref:Putative RNA-binding protein Luc7 2 isoform X1 n=1 Tax=Tropilaelaps mercedesae TaxID=418985 RepID=A0A1V9XXB5_9ACAR|nr:putative RNA-binding protein Luc7 2 isoform X1 [Tropilaelaps mercedesae]